MAAPPQKRRLSAEQRRALSLLADAGRSGVTAAIMLAKGFKTKMLAHLDQEGLATAMIAEDHGRRPTSASAQMTSRFPAPWRIVELPNGFAVEDATGKQIGVFYGRAPDSAGHTGIMTMDEARQMAVDFARLPELLNDRAAE
jgi:hypothetical protein